LRLALLAVLVFSSAVGAVAGQATLVLGEGLQEPFGVDFDAEGRTYIVEAGSHRITVLDPSGKRTVLAGNGEKGAGGDGGPAAQAQLNAPHHLLIGPDGHLYVADTANNCVRRIDLETGVITRVAGTGEKAYAGDGGPGADAQFSGIYAIAFHKNRLYMCDLGNRRIRVMDLGTGIVQTVAGNGEKGVPKDGEDARTQPLFDPRAVAVDDRGNVYILERNGHALRVVDTSGKIRTVAGNGEPGFSGDGGPAHSAQMRGPKHISIDDNGDVLIADTENHVIRRYSPRDGTIHRVAGSGARGAAGVDGPAEKCELNRPHGARVHPRTRAIYVSDSDNHRVLRVERPRDAYRDYVDGVLAYADRCRLRAQWDLALQAIDGALAAARQERDRVSEARLRVAALEHWNSKAFADQANGVARSRTALTEAMAAVGNDAPADVRARLADARGMQTYMGAFDKRGTFDDALPLFEEARALREGLPGQPELAESWFHVGLVHQQSNRYDAARPAFTQALRLAEASGDPVAIAYAERHLGFLDWEGKDRVSAETRLRRSLQLREQAGHTLGIAYASITLAEFLMEDPAASPQEMRALLDRALVMADAANLKNARTAAREALAKLAKSSGGSAR
jgi:DNA-binding beta-propeller fold protein YncE/tetratricopeptide (TPR) repeat protein